MLLLYLFTLSSLSFPHAFLPTELNPQTTQEFNSFLKLTSALTPALISSRSQSISLNIQAARLEAQRLQCNKELQDNHHSYHASLEAKQLRDLNQIYHARDSLLVRPRTQRHDNLHLNAFYKDLDELAVELPVIPQSLELLGHPSRSRSLSRQRNERSFRVASNKVDVNDDSLHRDIHQDDHESKPNRSKKRGIVAGVLATAGIRNL